ncbi:MAG: ComEC/Rec2 family competence protein [Bacteroidetes bacterium]|nr:ComEC/Rec2 family competence protein [Bacteroidota bacterium]
MNFPKIWKFLTPLLLGFLLPEFGWIPVLAMVVASAYASRSSVVVSTLLWVFSALGGQIEKPPAPWINPCQIKVELIGPAGKPADYSFEATVLQGNLRPGMRLMIKIPKSESQRPRVGEQWWVRGKAEWPSEPRNSNRFSDQKHLKSKGLDALVQVDRGGMVCVKDVDLDVQESRTLSKEWAERIQAHSHLAETGYLVRALLLGDKSGLSKSMKEWFRKTGLSHLLAVSGLHVGILFAGLNLILKVFPGKQTWLRVAKALLLSLALFGYAGLTGYTPSVLRAALMLGFAQWFVVFRKRANGLQSLGLAVYFLLALSPEMLLNAGFQLSVLAVAGILILEPVFKKYKPEPIPAWLWSGLSVSLSAQLSTAPLMLSWSGQFPTWFLLTNLLAIPVTTLFIYLSVVWLLGVLLLGSHALIDEMFSELGGYYLMGIEWMASWPNSELQLFKPAAAELILAYGLLIALLWKIASRSHWPYFWISSLLFAGLILQQQKEQMPMHLVMEAKRSQPKVFLWNADYTGPDLELRAELLPVKIRFKEKTIFLVNKPMELRLLKEADALVWLNKRKPPFKWVQGIPEQVKKYSLQDFPSVGWMPLSDSTDMILY